jgi:hypothetical protein
LEVNGEITTWWINLKNTFTSKILPESRPIPWNYNHSCKSLVSDLPLEVKTHGRCGCDTSTTTINCELKDLTETDQPWCYDLYQSDLPTTYLNESDPNCKDLKADKIKYFELWKLKEKDNAVDAPFVSYNNCAQLQPVAWTELGDYIESKLKSSSCLDIILNNWETYKWENYVLIDSEAKVTIKTHNMLNQAQWAKAIITMSRKNTYTYNSITQRSPWRAHILGNLTITWLKINETINDNKTITPQSQLISLFTIWKNWVFELTQWEISATEDIVNFTAESQNGIFQTWHEYFYRNPSSVRPKLYIVRASTGWWFSWNNWIISWPANYIHLDEKIDGTKWSWIEKYPPTQAEHDKLTYLSNEVEDNIDTKINTIIDNNSIKLFTWTTCSDCPYWSNSVLMSSSKNCKIKDKIGNIITDKTLGGGRTCNWSWTWAIWSY